MGDVHYYFAIAIHEFFEKMGVLVKFSAEAWAVMQATFFEYYDYKLTVTGFMRMIQSPMYQVRISRIDLTADYKNYGHTLMPDYIYRKLESKEYKICDHNSRVANRRTSACIKDWGIGTFYIGSKKENTKALLRVYDKKQEQISKLGFRLKEALACDDWTRFEVSYRGDYAHQISEQLLNEINTSAELSQYIAKIITDKYRFLDSNNHQYTDFTTDLLEVAENCNCTALRSESPQNNSISKSIAYIINGSGLFPLIFKIGQIWGDKTEKRFLKKLYDVYLNDFKDKAKKDRKIYAWLKRNKGSLCNQTLDSCFLNVTTNKDEGNGTHN